MKMLCLAASLAFLLASPALAQQTAIHSVPIGKGAGNTGFNAAVPGAAGQPLVSQGAAIDPAFGAIANSGFAAGPANTVKGSLNGTTVIDLPLPSCTGVNQTWKYTSGVGINCTAVSSTTGFDMPINLGLNASASGNALTLTLSQANGSAPTSASPVLVPFRSTTPGVGTVTWSTISAIQSITIPSGATLGTSNGVPFRVWIFLNYNGGAPELGVATCSNTTTIFPCAAWEGTLPTTIAIGGSSNTGGVLYATTGVAADAVRIIGYIDYSNGLPVAGAWSGSPDTNVQVFGPGIKKPGDVVQEIFAQTNSSVSTGATTVASNVTASIALSSAINLIDVDITAAANAASGANITGEVRRGTLTNVSQQVNLGTAGAVAVNGMFAFDVLDAPGVVTSTPYTLYFNSSTGTSSIPGGHARLREIQG
jgi:hypothetical protein